MHLTQRPIPNPTSPIPHKIVVDSPNSLSLSLSLLYARRRRRPNPNPREKSPLPNAVPGVKTSPTTQASATFPAQSPAPPRPGDTVKLRINRILNASGHAGRKFGNRAGVIGLMYAGLESGIVAVRDTDDVVNSVVAGLGTGALYRAAAGVRSAAVAGAIGGVVVGAAVTAKQVLKRYVPI
ncbi:hypothetical protein AAG906_029426 [Vitis piasezkii]